MTSPVTTRDERARALGRVPRPWQGCSSPEVRGRVERHHQQSVGDFGRQSDHLWPESAQRDGRRAVRVGPRVEHRRHQRVRPELAMEIEPLAGLPRGEDGPEGPDHLAHAGDGAVERGAVPLLDLCPDLGTESQAEAPPREELEIVGLVRQLHRVARKGDGDVGGELEGGRGPRGQDQRREHVVGTLERERTVDAELLQSAGVAGRLPSPANIVSNFTEPPIGSCLGHREATAAYGHSAESCRDARTPTVASSSGSRQGADSGFTTAAAARQTSAVASISFDVLPRKRRRKRQPRTWPRVAGTPGDPEGDRTGFLLDAEIDRVSERVTSSLSGPSSGRSPRPRPWRRRGRSRPNASVAPPSKRLIRSAVP